jgi:hypothetical protein
MARSAPRATVACTLGWLPAHQRDQPDRLCCYIAGPMTVAAGRLGPTPEGAGALLRPRLSLSLPTPPVRGYTDQEKFFEIPIPLALGVMQRLQNVGDEVIVSVR